MHIDWITVSAQIVNFLVLVYLLQHFLYTPVVQAMDKREKRVTDRLRDAEAREGKAKQKADEYAQKKEELESERRSLMEQYKQEARDEKQALLETARKDVQETTSQWQRQAAQEKKEFLTDLGKQTETTLTSIARKALLDLADTDLEGRVVDVFIGRLKNLDEDARKTFSAAKGKLRVSTAFDLDSKQRERVKRAVRARIGDEADVEFEVVPDLLCGIQLSGDGHALGWNLADYVTQVTSRMDSAIDNSLRKAE